MTRLGIITVLTSCVLISSCGGYYFVGFVSNPGAETSITGVVSAVKNGFLSDPTGFITPFTAVTFINSGTATTVNFCGDQQQWFPVNQNVRVEFTPGIHCSVLMNVAVTNDLGTVTTIHRLKANPSSSNFASSTPSTP